MAKKPNKKELLAREMACLENIGTGLVKEQNIEDLVDQFNITRETAEKVYFETTRKVAGLRESTFEELKAQVLCQMDVLYKKTMANRNYKTALEVLMAKTRISGLAESEKQKATSIHNHDTDEGPNVPKIIEVKEADFS